MFFMPGTHSLEAIEVAAPAMELAKTLIPDWQRATDTATDKTTAVQSANFILSHLISFDLPTTDCTKLLLLFCRWNGTEFPLSGKWFCLFPSTIIIEIENGGASLLHLKNESSLSLLYPCVVRTFLSGFFSKLRFIILFYLLALGQFIDL